jgi:hypothetical protein
MTDCLKEELQTKYGRHSEAMENILNDVNDTDYIRKTKESICSDNRYPCIQNICTQKGILKGGKKTKHMRKKRRLTRKKNRKIKRKTK